MKVIPRFAAPWALALALVGQPTVAGAAPAPTAVSLGDSIGPEIDAQERSEYHLFPDIEDFQSARIVEVEPGRYRLEAAYLGASGAGTKFRRISAEALEQTRLHVALSQEYRRARATARPESLAEADVMRILALRFASETRYDLASAVVEEMRNDFRGTEPGRWAEDLEPRIGPLAKRHRALIWPGTLLDRSGRTNLLVFSGYYGLWLGTAIPIALEADDAQAFAAGLIIAPAASVLITSAVTKDANIPAGQATMISLGGHLGTWQGIGWATLGDSDGHAAVGYGVLAGLAGIAAGIPIGRGFSEGPAAITNSALYWGGWFGAVGAVVANQDDTAEPVVRAMLITSDAFVLGAGVAARHARLSAARMRLIDLSGVLGTVFGFGVDLLFAVDSGEGAFGIAGAGSAAGLVIGAKLTRNYDACKDLAAGITVEGPTVSLARGGRSGRPVPTLGVKVGF